MYYETIFFFPENKNLFLEKNIINLSSVILKYTCEIYK